MISVKKISLACVLFAIVIAVVWGTIASRKYTEQTDDPRLSIALESPEHNGVGARAETLAEPETSKQDEILDALRDSGAEVESKESSSGTVQYSVRLKQATLRQLKLAAQLEGLHQLTVYGSSFRENLDFKVLMELIGSIPTLHSLTLMAIPISTQEELVSLNKLNQMESLRKLTLWSLFQDELPMLPPRLESLEVLGGTVNTQDCREIGKLRNLQDLKFTGVTIASRDFDNWNQLTHLQRLSAQNCTFPFEHETSAFSFLSECSLVEFSFESPMIDDNVIDSLLQNTQLHTVSLRGSSVKNDGVKKLLNQLHLETLDLSYTMVSDSGLELIETQQDLLRLDLGATMITDITLARLSRLQQLEKLNVASVNCSDNGLEFLANLKSIQELSVSQLPVTDSTLKNFSSLPLLEELHLIGCLGLTDEGVKHLMESKSLKRLMLTREAPFTKQYVNALNQLNPDIRIHTLDPDFIESLRLIWQADIE